MSLHKKIQELKRQALPINYRDLAVGVDGLLTEKNTSLLDQRVVEGYTVIWGKRNLHGEIFLKGAFARSIRERGPGSGANYEIKFLYNHDTDQPLSLFEELKEDDTGLYFRTKPLDDVQVCDDTLKRLKSRTLNNFSHGFDYIWSEDKIAYDETTDSLIIKEAILYEISVATIPSGMDTYVIRSVEAMDALDSDVEYYIKSLPRNKQLEARQLFARHKSMLLNAPPFTKGERENKLGKRSIDSILLDNEIKIF